MLRPQGGRPVRLGTRGVTGVHVRVILRSFQHRSVPVEWCAARKRVVQILFHYQIKLPTRVRLWAPPSAPQIHIRRDDPITAQVRHICRGG